jgi:hypothetical protein
MNLPEVKSGDIVWVGFEKQFSRKSFAYEGPAKVISRNIRMHVFNEETFYFTYILRLPIIKKTIRVTEHAITVLKIID